ncbi:MAG: GT4 family glycosyltransferase PelF [Rhodosalinus sp.]
MTEAAEADICLVVEGAYPYVAGGVSSWMDWLIRSQPETRFTVVAVVADDRPRESRYQLPPNVVSLQSFALSPRARRPRAGRPDLNPTAYSDALLDLWVNGDLGAFDRLSALAQTPVSRHGALSRWRRPQRPDHADLVSSELAWDAMCICYDHLAPQAAFSEFFWAWRTLVGGLMAVLTAPVPKARAYHAISTGYAGLYAARAARATGARCAITEHGIYTNERRIDLIKAEWITDTLQRAFDLDDVRRDIREVWISAFEGFARATYAASDHITTLYSANQSFQRTLGAEEDRLRVIPNGIVLEKFAELTPKRGKPRPVVGLIGRVVPIKDIEACILAAARIRDAVPDVEVRIIGPTDEDPAYFEACRARVVDLGLENTVVFTGLMNIIDVLPDLDVLLLSSISEAQPLVLLEAGAAGLPCVATDVGSCREIIEGPPSEDPPLGAGGRIVPAMDAEALGAATVELLQDEDLRRACGEALRRRVKTHFTAKAAAERYSALYRELAA